MQLVKTLLLLLSAIVGAPFVAASIVSAEGVSETNYLHIPFEEALVARGFYSAANLERESAFFDGVTISAKVLRPRTAKNSVTGDGEEMSTISIGFDEDICVIGVKVAVNTRGVRNGVQVQFLFKTRDDEGVDRETRWPAGGTTLQSFRSDSFASRFAAVDISAASNSGLAIGDILALRCPMALS
ncbi:hypothetical protein PXK00_14650 [Phaeobacter sp. QD34_3]|uniref:hypothetical protein n=1 Tax=unclassified Phaeobacter TaxID=2621772 RepID=UPI00237F8191|nr:MULTISPECIES: hypothetical protein [unclassified Phaeobacter]MDE4134360.1 hypothetical protein [Phaeobacter sp. QD34_3]MDE4137693.1 hypothetical protein [Phaeobacter sp. QD34_24]